MDFLVTSLPGFTEAGLPLAGARAGGIGLLNLQYERDPSTAVRAVRSLVETAGEHRVGLVLAAPLGALEQAALEALGQAEMILLAADAEPELAAAIAQCRRHARRVGMIVTSLSEAERAIALGVDLLVAKGHEAGGLVGEETSFVLVQALCQRDVPLFAWGGIGWNTAAACAAVGCAGVVLDWQLALLRESPLGAGFRRRLQSMDGSEVASVQLGQNRYLRFYSQPGLTARAAIEACLEQQAAAGAEATASINPLLSALAVESRDRDRLWLTGQDAVLAADWARQAPSVGRALNLLRERVTAQVKAASEAPCLTAHSPLAASHGTEYPLVQGPMTRVSDVPEFCQAVAENGALPFLALALLGETQVRSLLERTKELLGPRPWGVGMLGFVPQEIRAQQWPVIQELRPSFALIAGGRPDQAASLEAHGIATYLHVPSPGMLDMFLREGARRFVFEGRECGGHVGPRTSFVLWETMIRGLLSADLSAEEAAKVHVLFAGGIHDRLGAAIVSVLAQPLVERGMKVGALLGTAYLFTHEIVATRAVVDGFQAVALEADRTVVVETGPGHAIRCAETEFVGLFDREKRRMIAERRPPEELRAELEHMNLGRLRIAAKGVSRGESQRGLVELDDAQQRQHGMYMLGQVAALRTTACSLRELHEEVCAGSAAVLSARPRVEVLPAVEPPAPRPLDIAIVGMACLLPGANDPGKLWHNLLTGHDPITEIPPDRFEFERWFDSNRKARDKIYSKWGGFVDDIPFNPLKFGIPPASLSSIEPMQLLAMELVDRALRDAGYDEHNPHRERTSIVLGVGGGAGELGSSYAFRATLPRFVENPNETLWEQLPEWTEDSFAGILFNVVAGRVSNRFDFGGTNCTIDAACGSSLAALYWACQELINHRADMAITGGCDTMQNAFGYLCFAKAGALSPRGRARVFDATADGIVISEGHAAVVLKRREDAERDGDKIYAVIRAVSSGSDGRSKGLTAPRVEGQLRTLRRAYEQSGIDPTSVGMFEAHGTGTAVGDETEGTAVTTLLKEAGAQEKSVALGSIKSMIGHTKCAAGAVGLIKAILALQNRVLPPTMHVERPNPKAGLAGGPLYVNSEARPWLSADQPRRAGVSSFGFGGTNYHVLIEEYPGSQGRRPLSAREEREYEVFVLSGDTPEDLQAAARNFQADASGVQASGINAGLSRLAYTLHLRNARVDKPRRAVIVARSLDELLTQLRSFESALTPDGQISGRLPPGVYYTSAPLANQGAVALLFPGQGSQFPGMLQSLATEYGELLETFERADAALAPVLDGPLSRWIFPPPAFSDDERRLAAERLKATQIAQPALGACGVAMWRLLQSFGIRAQMTAGHSFGELVALCAAGSLSEAGLFELAAERGQAMAAAAQGGQPGAMLAASADAQSVRQCISGIDGVWIANLNSPTQTVLSGASAGIASAQERLTAAGITARPLPVSAAFHSPFMKGPREQFSRVLSTTTFSDPQLPVYANVAAAAYDGSTAEIRSLLAQQLTSEVRFVEQIEAMYRDGARIFVEAGPKGVLTGLVREILRDRPHLAIATQPNGEAQGKHFLYALAGLVAHGVEVNLDRLYDDRVLEPLSRDALAGKAAGYPPHTWLVNGAYCRKATEPRRTTTPRALLADPQSTSQTSPPTTPLALPEPTRNLQTETPMNSHPSPRFPVRPSVENGLPATNGQNGHSHPQRPLPAESAHGNGHAAPAAPPSGGGNMDAQAYAMFQETMRQFLHTQENVLRHLFSGGPVTTVSSDVATHTYVEHHAVADVGYASAVPPLAEPIAPVHAAPAYVEPVQPVTARAAREVPPARPSEPARVPQVAAAETSKLSFESLAAALVDVVADRTGYPAEMLNVDVNLEGELGIDSIKRVEIIAAFRRQVLPAMQEPPAEFMERLSAAKTMRAIVEIVGEMAGASAPASATQPVASAEAKDTSALDPDDMLVTLLGVVADRTGYPVEMLNLDINLEGELGIDSIKRVEIIAAFRRQILPDMKEPPAELMERLTAAKTMRAILDCFFEPAVSTLDPAAVAAPTTAAATSQAHGKIEANSAESAEAEDCPRCVAEVIEIPLSSAAAELATGSIVVTADDRGLADRLAREWQAAGRAVAILTAEDVVSADAARAAVARVRQAHGPVAAIVHLSPLDECPSFPQISPEAWQARVDHEIKGLLYLLQAAQPELTQTAGPSLRVLCASLGGGDFTNEVSGSPDSPEATRPWRGGLAGLLKVAACEYPQHAFRLVDVLEPPSEELLLAELLAPGPVEVGYRAARRLAIRTRHEELSQPLASASVLISSRSVVLVTGGAKGVTAEIVAEMAQHAPARFVLIGRSALPQGSESAHTSAIEGDLQLRQAIIAHLRASGGECTPARVEAELARIKSDREIRRTLARLEQRGATVEYLPCDVRDANSLKAVVETVRARHGAIDAIVHGAGIIDDHKIQDKTAASFDRVLGTKIDPLMHLVSLIDPAALKLVVLMTSTSGFFGNSGQCDYAAANEILNRLARRLRALTPAKVVAFNWGPWQGAGMVTPEVARKMQSQGVDLIGLRAGREAAWRDMASPEAGCPRVVLGRGPWLNQEHAATDRDLSQNGHGPLISGQEIQVHADGGVSVRVTLDKQRPYLQHHCIEGKAVLPVAVAVALMAETARAAHPDWHVVCVENVRMLSGITLDGEARDILIRAEVETRADSSGQWRVRITAPDAPKRSLYEARIHLAPSFPAASGAEQLPPINTPLEASVAEAYHRWLFHGPSYQVIEAFGGADEAGIDAVVRPGATDECVGLGVAPWVIDPILIDAAPQLAMIWSRVVHGVSMLPSRIGSYRIFGPLGGGKLEMQFRVRPGTDREIYQADVWLMREGKLIAHMEGLEGAGSPQLNRIAASSAV